MTDRIQELAEQARVSLPVGNLTVEEWIRAYNHRLGELIVEDVLAIVQPRHDSRTEKFRTHKILYNSIKQHFAMDQDPCDHHWTVNHNIMSNGWLCDKCYECSIQSP